MTSKYLVDIKINYKTKMDNDEDKIRLELSKVIHDYLLDYNNFPSIDHYDIKIRRISLKS
jgi:hypothetical protein